MNKRIYVVCPAYLKTGGTELAHQLVKFYTDEKIDAQIAYVDVQKFENPLNLEFEKYVNEWIDISEIEDLEDYIIVFPEFYTEYLSRFNKARKVIWWMSVDNFEMRNGFRGALKFLSFGKVFKWWLKGSLRDLSGNIKLADLHVYQSEYARLYLKEQGIENALPLSDYINDVYFEERAIDITERENNVLYNPKKGIEFTQKIIKQFPEFNWIPIQNMTTKEVREILQKSKVYIDFGNHPGKDRFPREAVASGCCIITGKLGAAGNNIDVMIPKDYKFDDSTRNIWEIGNRINDCLKQYDKRVLDFKEYVKRTKNEKMQFYKEAMDLYNAF